MLWVLFVLAAVTAAAYYRRSRRRLYRLAREIPSDLKEYPIIGHAYIFFGTCEDRMKGLQRLGQLANQQNGLTHCWLANKLFISITDAKAIEVVSKSCLDKDEYTMKFFRTFLGNGSIFAPVKIWHPRRRIMARFFNLRNIKLLNKVFDEQSTIMTKLMQVEIGRGDFSIWKYLTMYTFDTVFETTTGVKMHAQVNGGHWILSAIDEITSSLSERILQPWLHPDCVYSWMPVYRRIIRHKERVHEFVEELINKLREKLTAVQSNDEGKDIGGYQWVEHNKNHLTFFDTIVQSSGGTEKGYTNAEIEEEGIVIVVAGNDTSAVGSSFAAVMLSRHPEVQERVYQELEEVFGDSDRAVTSEDLSSLKYLDAVLKETLRLYPPVPAIYREIHEDVVLPSGATLVDGTSVVFNIWGTHRNPAYWGADADQFRPERFLEGPLPHPAQFIPFSYSVRSCIGGTYAMLSMKTGLVNLLRRYRLLPPANMAAADLRAPLRVKYNIMMKAVDNFVVRIEERKK